ncbi:MAG: hypothetical protein ABI567_07295 [Gammaproteobacteria bacterium]
MSAAQTGEDASRTNATQVLANCAALATSESLPPVNDLGIMSCGTPALLRRSVSSWVEFSRRHGRDLRITIIDDSPTPERTGAQRATAKALENELGVQLRLVDPESRSLIARELAARAGVAPEIADFAVAGCPGPRVGIGGSRNLLNLLLPGRRLLLADDDIIARFEVPPPHELALWITAEDVPMHTYFFESVGEAETRVPVSAEPDALALHESFVGHSVASVVARLPGRASLQGAPPALIAALQARPVRIAATALGLTGDCASDCLGFFSLLATGATAQHVLARPTPLSPSREVLRRPEFPVLCQGVYFITYCHAVDNRLPLPPYFPVGRGEDQTWQKLLHFCLPDTVVGHLPLAVRHRPDGLRQYAADDYLDPCARFPGNAFLLGVLGIAPEPGPGESAEARLAAMGGHLARTAADPARFLDLVRRAWRAYLAHHQSLVASAVASRPDHPAWWQDAMRSIQSRLAVRLARPDDVPLEYAAFLGSPAIEAMRPDVQRFARLLEAWPSLRSAAGAMTGRMLEDTAWLRP